MQSTVVSISHLGAILSALDTLARTLAGAPTACAFVCDGVTYTREEMLLSSAHAPEMCQWLRAARPGDHITTGCAACVCVQVGA